MPAAGTASLLRREGAVPGPGRPGTRAGQLLHASGGRGWGGPRRPARCGTCRATSVRAESGGGSAPMALAELYTQVSRAGGAPQGHQVARGTRGRFFRRAPRREGKGVTRSGEQCQPHGQGRARVLCAFRGHGSELQCGALGHLAELAAWHGCGERVPWVLGCITRIRHQSISKQLQHPGLMKKYILFFFFFIINISLLRLGVWWVRVSGVLSCHRAAFNFSSASLAPDSQGDVVFVTQLLNLFRRTWH